MSRDLLERLDARAAGACIGRTEAIRRAIGRWCDDEDAAVLRRREAERG